MELTLFDHILVAILFILFPILSVTDYRRFQAQLDAGKPTARLSLYWLTMAWSWGLTLAVAGLWLVYKRSVPQLGLGLEIDRGFLIGLAATVVACGLYIVQAIVVRRHPDRLRAARAQIESLKEMFPRTARDARAFSAMSISAGICEELIYRGYLMAYITSVIGTERMWTAALLSSLVFGLGHTYQGPKGVLKTALIGLIMAGLYVLTGSLWLPMVLHTVIDLVGGSIGCAVMAACEAVPEAEEN
ncbi:MAG: CPBP family intramembrane metalloprotease [bacterium]|nr:CPBP family intramembrane metalloprotease [bacterium]